ncbi:MAG: AbrB/MazE/SpoVT family DNA-binding domain-containing protein [Planctomycetes bacterium]|nr:AbrB/MazE/SpoVT family DNA-binding domain-containing protein [Planctomycetota bacterium]
MLATLTAKGQVILPKVFRNQLNLNAGDKIDFVMLDNGVMQMVSLKHHFANLKSYTQPSKAISVEEMNEVIAQGFNKQ